jgi:type IV pilus assembly protein PilE
MKQHELPRRWRGRRSRRGFTLVELTVALAAVAILVSVVLPSYAAHVRRSHISPALIALSKYQASMERYFLDNHGRYDDGNGACAVPLPAIDGNHFTLACTLKGTGGFVATVRGIGGLSGYRYAMDDVGRRSTLSHPLGIPSGNCWSIRGKSCDT